MSEFIKLTMPRFHGDGRIDKTLAIRPESIISISENLYNDFTEVEIEYCNGTYTYTVTESVDEILRKIDPLPYTDLEKYIFNTPTLYKTCGTCKYNDRSPDTEPCYSCDYDHDNNWEPKEDQNG